MSETVIKIENLRKKYKLGTIGGGTLTADLQSWWARKMGKEDPNTMIGFDMSKVGESFYALDGINLEVNKGEAIGVIGGNGAGKSTLLKILSRVTAPTEGTVKINGRIASMLEVGTGFHPELTGRENIYMNGAILGMTKDEIDSKMEDIIDFSECRQFIDTPVKRYSSGMYVKLAFAVAAHLDAEIMIMDEVLAVGDVKFQQKCLGKMGDAANENGKTILYVSHNMSTIRQLCTRCIVLKKGKIIFDGDTETAISVYMDMADDELQNHYQLEDLDRRFEFLNQKVRFKELWFEGDKAPTYYERDCISMKIKIKAYESVDSLRLFMPVKALDGTPVSLIESGDLGSIHKGEEKIINIKFDIEGLVAGKYYFWLTAFSLGMLGGFERLDQPAKRIMFEIVEQNVESVNRLKFDKKYWGYIRMDQVEGEMLDC